MTHLRRWISSFCVVAVIVAFGACAGQNNSLDGKVYLLNETSGIDALIAAPLRLEFSDGKIGISRGCNLIGGSYRLIDNRLKVNELMQTEMACENNRMAQDVAIIDLLLTSPTLDRRGSVLTLTDNTRITRWDVSKSTND
jgi:heat shock protein HslJ